MPWGQVTVGGVDLRETTSASEDGTQLQVTGQESHPPQTRAEVIAAHHNVVGAHGLTVPVVFTDKTDLTGFYRVTQAGSDMVRHANGAVQAATWNLTMEKVGGARDVEVESRVPTVARLTDTGVAPVFWHAPASGHDSYWTGPTVPGGQVARQSSDGPVTAYLDVPLDVAPRWTAPVASYLLGAARVEFDGIRRIGPHTPPLTVWVLHNGLVRVTSGQDGAIAVSCWSQAAGDWVSSKEWQVTVNGAALTSAPELSIVRNDPEEVVVRLTYPVTPGRVTVDLALRRGARFVTGIVKRHGAATLGVKRTAAEAGTASGSWGVRATATDADGNQYAAGTAKNSTVATGTAALSRVGSTALDFWLGHVVGSASPAVGDTLTELQGQYLGSSGERAKVVRR